jgi:hypothetical protein
VLFMVGSLCFALGSIPGYASLVEASVVGTTFFIGSIFFTSAAFLQLVQSARAIDWWASMIQLVGTVWFNVNTFEAMQTGVRRPPAEPPHLDSGHPRFDLLPGVELPSGMGGLPPAVVLRPRRE